jgi:hypothetical protein
MDLKQQPFLRPILIKNAYPSFDDYLDTHFRLLREDFIDPLRNGISSYRQGNLDWKGDIRIYNKVYIGDLVCTRSGVVHQVLLDMNKLKRINWEKTKRLLTGGLVCLSKDGFETIFWAVVATRQNIQETGSIEIRFLEDAIGKINPNDPIPFDLIESASYFEAYQHVLKRLQEIRPRELPFQEYLLGKTVDVKPPRYLAQNAAYNLSCVFPNTPPIPLFHPPDNLPGTLDVSQREAFFAALTREFAIIQGPPGTGKVQKSSLLCTFLFLFYSKKIITISFFHFRRMLA